MSPIGALWCALARARCIRGGDIAVNPCKQAAFVVGTACALKTVSVARRVLSLFGFNMLTTMVDNPPEPSRMQACAVSQISRTLFFAPRFAPDVFLTHSTRTSAATFVYVTGRAGFLSSIMSPLPRAARVA